jgi:hypothetical protein
LRDRSEDNTVRLLTYYLARNRRRMQQVFADFDAQALDQVRSIEMRETVPLFSDEEFQAFMTTPEDTQGGDLLRAAIAHNEHLVRYYALLLKEPMTVDAALLLQNLSRIEESDIAVLKKMVAMHYF